MMKLKRRGSSRYFVSALLLASLAVITGCEPEAETLIQVTTEKEANEILVVLNGYDIQAHKRSAKGNKRKTVWEVRLPAGAPAEMANARKILRHQNLPRDAHSGFDSMLSTTGMIPTKSDERARLADAQAGELQFTFEMIEHIISARIHIAIPEYSRIGNSEVQPPSAAVVLKYIPGELSEVVCELDQPLQVGEGGNKVTEQSPRAVERLGDRPICPADVRAIVTKSVTGLNPKNVTVHYSRAPNWVPVPKLAADSVAVSGPMNLQDESKFIWTVSGMSAVIVFLLCLLLWGNGRRGELTDETHPEDSRATG